MSLGKQPDSATATAAQAAQAIEAGPRPAVTAGIGAFLLAVAVAVVFDARHLPPGVAHSVGPAAAMRIVAAFLALLGVAHLITAWRQRAAAMAHDDGVRGQLAPLAWVLGALAGLMAILQFGGGFVVAAAWLFALTARGFGAPIGPKSVAVGLVLAALVYLFFTQALGLTLPAGPLERLIK